MSEPYVRSWVGNQAVQLANSTIIRPVYFPPDWKIVRVGMLMGCTTGSMVNMQSHVKFFCGICSGYNGYGVSSNITHAFGARTGTNNFTYQSSSATISYYQLSNVFGMVESNGVRIFSSTVINTGTTYFNIVSEANNKGRFPYYVTITRGDPDYSIRISFANAATPGVTTGRVTEQNFLSQMMVTNPSFDSADTPTISNPSALTIPVSEASGSFDSINIAWNREDPNPELLVHAVAFALLE
jgi:hypothetical protein